MSEGKSGIGQDPRSCGPAAARLQNALQVLQVRRRSLRKTISNWRARKGGLSDMVATAAAIVPATVAARGARLQTKAQQGRRTGDITRLLRIPTYAGDGAQRTGQTSTDELPGTSGDHGHLKSRGIPLTRPSIPHPEGYCNSGRREACLRIDSTFRDGVSYLLPRIY